MKPRYAIVNIRQRDLFEKEFHMPYGYGDSYISFDSDEAIKIYESMILEDKFDPREWVVEEYSKEGRCVFYQSSNLDFEK